MSPEIRKSLLCRRTSDAPVKPRFFFLDNFCDRRVAHSFPLSTSPRSNPRIDTVTFRHGFNLLDFESEERQFLEETSVTLDPSNSVVAPENMPSRLISLPLHVVYYILEFMVAVQIFFGLY